jgi:ankyrin repeat protein
MLLLGKNNNGDTALKLAINKGHESIVMTLLAAGADVKSN